MILIVGLIVAQVVTGLRNSPRHAHLFSVFDLARDSGLAGKINESVFVRWHDQHRARHLAARTEEMLNAAIEDGMTTLMQDGVQKVLLGQTTFKEVKAVAIK